MDKTALVITSCTGEKVFHPDNQLTQQDFVNPERLAEREGELASYCLPAAEMYTGGQHLDLMKGVRQFRQAGGRIDVAILSAGYGLLEETARIVPYDITFNTMRRSQIVEWSHKRNVPDALAKKMAGHDLVFFLLGDKYIQALDLPLGIKGHQKRIFFAGTVNKTQILSDDHYLLEITEMEARQFHRGLVRIKGALFARLLTQLTEQGGSWDVLFRRPELTREYILRDYAMDVQGDLFDGRNETGERMMLPFISELFPISPNEVAPNSGREFLYFMPENDDRVDPTYDFLTDTARAKRDPLTDDWYAHQFYPSPQYNGLLLSKVNIDKASQRKRELIQQQGIREFLHLPANYPIMGDCGAFSYKDQYLPPYDTGEVLQYYDTLGFNFGVSVDHLIVGPYQSDESERNRRFRLTLENAADFIKQYKMHHHSFAPIGVAQAWDPGSFREAIQELIQQGYVYVALGGLALEKSSRIFEIAKAIAPIIPNPDFRVHLFGVARDMATMRAFHQLGITSFDSASPLRRAWLGTGHNYHGVDGKHYAAIRIPEAFETKGRVKKMLAHSVEPFATYKQRERHALESLRAYDKGQIEIDQALQAILDYDHLLGEDRAEHKILYRQVLVDKPWKTCGCTICHEIGIEVLIFRGNNRNRRRGFHNTHVYFHQICELQTQLGLDSVRTP